MAIYDITFLDGDLQNFILEVGTGVTGSFDAPIDILTDNAAILTIPEKAGETEKSFVFV